MSGEAHRGLEAAKWTAFAFMVGDHVNAFLLPEFVPLLYLLGRLVFPMFALCLAFGLAGRGSLVLDGTIRRLLIWACIAQIPWSMFPHTDTLNVIFSLAFGALVYQAIFVRGLGWMRYTLAGLSVVLSGMSEFGFAGLVVVVCSMWYAETRSRVALFSGVVGLALLYAANATWFAMLAPLVFWAIYKYAELPRLRHAFYWMYPGHLVLIAFVRWWL